ncbi:MAG: hypothetical protein HZA93_23795 [Verrucomicrobia bacterium]|nr:hypothetical protein [Verrucomicrobiota bacterium]
MTPTAQTGAVALPLFFAESSFSGVKASALGEQLVIMAALLIIAKLLWDFADRFRGGSPQKREVTLTENFATTHQHQELRAELEKLDRERRTSVAELHKKVEALSERLDARIDEIPGRTIALLNETKQLHKP